MRRRAAFLAAAALLALPAALAFGRGGYFAVARTRGAIAACLLLAVAAVAADRPIPRSTPARLALGGLAALTSLTGLSMLWAPLGGPALADLERLALYTAAFTAAAALLAPPRRGASPPATPGASPPPATPAASPPTAAPAVSPPPAAPAVSPPIGPWVEPALLATTVVAASYGLSERLLPWLVSLERLPAAGDRLAQPLTYWNAQGALAALGIVLAAGLAADRGRPAALRSAAAACAPVLGLDLYLTLSRGAIGACLAGLAIVVALVPTRGGLRAAAVVAAAAALPAAAGVVLSGVQDQAGSSGQGAVMLALLAALSAAAAVAIPGAGGGTRLAAVPRLAVGALVVLLAATVAAAATGGREGAPAPGGQAQRLVSVKSNRYAYWRTAAAVFAEHPLRGIGSGSFRVEWLKRRPFAEGVRDAHSLYLETAAELGLIGVAALASLLAGVALAARDALRREGAAATAATAAVGAWALHAGIDWDWEMPALSLLAVLLAARLAASGAPHPE